MPVKTQTIDEKILQESLERAVQVKEINQVATLIIDYEENGPGAQSLIRRGIAYYDACQLIKRYYVNEKESLLQELIAQLNLEKLKKS